MFYFFFFFFLVITGLNTAESELLLNQLLFLNGAVGAPSFQSRQVTASPPTPLPPASSTAIVQRNASSSSQILPRIPSFPEGSFGVTQSDPSFAHNKALVLKSTKLGNYPLHMYGPFVLFFFLLSIILIFFISYHVDSSAPKQRLLLACQQLYGNWPGLQEFSGQMLKRLPEWFKNCRNATTELLEALAAERVNHPDRLTADLIRYPSPVWKCFHLLFPLPKDTHDSILAIYFRWVDIVVSFRQAHPHTSGESLFENLEKEISNGTTPHPFSLLRVTNPRLLANWQPPQRYQLQRINL